MICDFSINCAFVCWFELWSVQYFIYWVNMANIKNQSLVE